MVQMSVIEARLSQLGVKISRLYRPEILELQQLLNEDEKIFSIVPGRYFGGFALLAATDRRLILIDKKTMFLTVEVIPYDMVSEVDMSARLLDASVMIFTLNKQHRFICMRHKAKLRDMANYIQQKMMEIRYGSSSQNQPQAQMRQSVSADFQQNYPAPELRPEPEPLIVPIPKDTEHHLHFAPHTPQAVAQAPAKVKQLVGAAALNGSRWPLNPYVQSSFMIRKQYSRFS